MDILKNLKLNAPIKVNGKEYKNSYEAYADLKNYEGPIQVLINYKDNEKQQNNNADKMLRIYVKKYMTQKSTPGFDFMKKWNNNNPMPMRLMEGTILDETPGMYKMKLKGVYVENADKCTHCGRPITNEVSKMYGLGPVCGQHFYIATPQSVEEFRQMKDEIKQKIESVEWEGWVIKSAIEKQQKIYETA